MIKTTVPKTIWMRVLMMLSRIFVKMKIVPDFFLPRFKTKFHDYWKQIVQSTIVSPLSFPYLLVT